MRNIRRKFALVCALVIVSAMTVSAFAAETRTPEVYDIETELVYTYKMKGNEAFADIRALLAELKDISPEAGAAWERIMDYWSYVNEDLNINMDVLPDGLPQDDSLCIVVLGYQLNPDGTMADELVGRCKTALRSAEKYPNAYIAVTGGGTAMKVNTTEAAQMASWFVSNGIDPERIITEGSSMTTTENARFTCNIILEEYPQIRSVAIVSSDYHLPLGCLLFKEQFLLSSVYRDTYPVEVISNAGFAAETPQILTVGNIKGQASYVWNICDGFELGA